MPFEDGYKLFQILRDEPEQMRRPVIFLAGEDADATWFEAKGLGVSQFVRKSANHQVLKLVVALACFGPAEPMAEPPLDASFDLQPRALGALGGTGGAGISRPSSPSSASTISHGRRRGARRLADFS